jgi:hypothetical protein
MAKLKVLGCLWVSVIHQNVIFWVIVIVINSVLFEVKKLGCSVVFVEVFIKSSLLWYITMSPRTF